MPGSSGNPAARTVPASDCAALSDISPDELARTIADLRGAQRRLVARPRRHVIDALAAAVDAWLAPGSRWLARAVALLPRAAGFSTEMIRHALPTMLEPLRAPALQELLAAEVGNRRGPALILHILPGNLPGLAAIPAALSLAIGSATLLKAGRGDRVFPALFAASIAEHDAELGACVAACYWPGGARAHEDLALAAADLVVASGDDATVAALAARTRGRFIGHGHRVSFAVVTSEIAADPAAARRAASDLAADVALWDQRGCLSPQLCFVEGELDAARSFAALVAESLATLAQRVPSGRPSGVERLALRRFRDDAEWSGLGGTSATLFALGAEADGTVVAEPVPQFRSTPLGRSLRVMPLRRLAELGPLLSPVRSLLEAAGLAASPARWSTIAAALAAAGVHRVCALGEMQRPPLAWRQGGRPRVADWVSPSA